jgi:hypothetical protein
LEPRESFQGEGIRSMREFEERNQKKKKENGLEGNKFGVLIEELVEKKDDKNGKMRN